MLLARMLPIGLMQAAALQDTIVTLMVPQRDLFDWVGGAFQVIGWVLSIALLVRVVMLLATVRATLNRLSVAVIELGNEVRPVIHQATAVLGDAREVIALVRTDVERLGETAAAVSEQVLDVTEAATAKVDEVQAVLEVLQAELEGTAINAVSTARGLRVAAGSIGTALLHGDGRPRGPRTSRGSHPSGTSDTFDDDGFLDDIDDEFADDLDHEVERALDTDLDELGGFSEPRRA